MKDNGGACPVQAVLLAAGAGARMGENKLAFSFGGKTPLRLCLDAFLQSGCAWERIAIAVSDETRAEALAYAAEDARIIIAEGGKTRGESVHNALRALRAQGVQAGVVAIHDAARCLVQSAVIRAAVAGAMEFGSGIAAIPMRDTVRDGAGGMVVRENLLAMQTPQAFNFLAILAAYEKAEAEGFAATDDCAVYAAAGHTPHFTQGSLMNQKLTYQEDVPFFRAACGGGVPRTGFGEDTHALAAGRKLVLGGVEIPFETGLQGHSDADVLTHAIIDALLGAAALGDIGRLFPDADARYHGISSLLLLKEVAALLQAQGFAVGNIDATIVAQRPKLAPYAGAMRKNIAQALCLPLACVSIKATTTEGMNAEGAGLCMTARAVAAITNHR